MPKKKSPGSPPEDAAVCGNCHFFDRDEDEPEYGYCLALPPIPMHDESGNVWSAEPTVPVERRACIHFKRKLNA